MALYECDLTLSKKKKQCKRNKCKKNKRKKQNGNKGKKVELDSVANLQLYSNYNWISTNYQGLNHTDKHLSQVDYHNT